MMKLRGIVLLGVLLLSLAIPALAKTGPYLETIYFDVRMQEEIGIQDTAAGKTDLFFWGLSGPQVKGLDRATLDRLDMVTVPSGSWSLLLNPIPNAAPYTVKVENKEYFNPLAMREIRFALNDLINRQYIVDEILGGAGGPMLTMATPGQPGTYRYNLVASKLGLTPEGDEKKAIAAIDKAFRKASELNALQGKLKKDGDFWTFNNEPVTIKFAIRVDDPNGRLLEGQYVAKQIEKAGIKVERLLWDRAKCNNEVYGGNPANYAWHIYTEGWGAGATRAWWDNIVAQMYAPFQGYMPGGGEPGFWNYDHPRIDELAKKAYTGAILTDQEYWDTVLEATKLALQDSVRIHVCYQMDYFVFNKNRFKGRFAYGLGDGLNNWSLVTAQTKDGTLKATQFSAKGALFMSAWDPVGTDGFNDMYSLNIATPLTDPSMFESPVSAKATACRAVPTAIDSKVKRDAKGALAGQIPVPTTAIAWDSKNDKWVAVKSGTLSMSKGAYKFRLGNWHHGIPMSLHDFLYADAFIREWCNKDGANDPYYEETYSSSWKPINDTIVGTVYDLKNKTATAYFNYNFPADKGKVAYYGAPEWRVTAANQPIGVCWEIVEAMARMVATKKSASKTVYTFSASTEGATEVDVLRPSCVADIKAELKKMIAEKHVPASLKKFLPAADAVKRYQAALKFVEKYGHAYISNGPFYLAKFDAKANYALLKANRDATYPFTTDYWMNQFKTTILSVEKIEVPPMNKKGEEVPVKIHVAQSVYPNDDKSAADKGAVKLLLITDTGELAFQAELIGAGVYAATIPASAVSKLEAGSYVLLAMAELQNSVPATSASTLVVY